MPKPRSPQNAVIEKYGNKYGYLAKYSRLYIRSDKKFKPFGWKLDFVKHTRTANNRYQTDRTTLVVSDDEIGYIS
jgi:hypothetical protein